MLDGKYRIERVLGIGSMGVVVSAAHLHLGQMVALKLLRAEVLKSTEVVGRFLREARSAVRLKSEHVARVIDVGTLPNGAPFIVMEYLEGRDLGVILRERRLSLEEAASYGLQALEGLAEAHSLGIVHSDLKPANLFLTLGADGAPLIKVLDFGISKARELSASDFVQTQEFALIGTPAYMSPEQMQSARDVDGRADLWALGVVLYELVYARRPFPGETMAELCSNVLREPPRSFPTLEPPVPPAFEAVLLRCLEKDLARRYQTAAELAIALAPFVPGGGLEAVARIERTVEAGLRRSRPPSEAAGWGLGTESPRWPVASPRSNPSPSSRASLVGLSRRGKLLASGGLGALVLAGGIVLLLAPRGTSPGALVAESLAPPRMEAVPDAGAPAASATPELDAGGALTAPLVPTASAARVVRPWSRRTPTHLPDGGAETIVPPESDEDVFDDRK